MSAFGDDNFDDNEVDPAADFLAREQSQLAGLEDELGVVQQPSPTPLLNGNSSPPNGIQLFLRWFVYLEVNSYFVFTEPVKTSSPKPHTEREEPEKIKKWREQQQKRLTEKGEVSNQSCHTTSTYVSF